MKGCHQGNDKTDVQSTYKIWIVCCFVSYVALGSSIRRFFLFCVLAFSKQLSDDLFKNYDKNLIPRSSAEDYLTVDILLSIDHIAGIVSSICEAFESAHSDIGIQIMNDVVVKFQVAFGHSNFSLL